jgi:hypothetical protein
MQHEDQYGELAKAPAGNPVANLEKGTGLDRRAAARKPARQKKFN